MIRKMSDVDALRQLEVDGKLFTVDVYVDGRGRVVKLNASVTLPVGDVNWRFSITMVDSYKPAPDVDHQFQTYVHVMEPPAKRRLLIYCNEVFSDDNDVTTTALNLSRLIGVHVRGV